MIEETIKTLWHPIKNTFAHDVLSIRSHKKAWWQCALGHEWESPIREFSGKCPFCINRRVLPGFNDLATTHPQLLKEWSDKNISFPSCFTAGSKEKIIWICTENHEWEAPIYRRAKQNTRCATVKIR